MKHEQSSMFKTVWFKVQKRRIGIMTQDQEARRTKDSGVRYGIHQIHNNEVQSLKRVRIQQRGKKKPKNITMITDNLKKTATKNEELVNSQTRWTARILNKGIYILPWKNSCTIIVLLRWKRYETSSGGRAWCEQL